MDRGALRLSRAPVRTHIKQCTISQLHAGSVTLRDRMGAVKHSELAWSSARLGTCIKQGVTAAWH